MATLDPAPPPPGDAIKARLVIVAILLLLVLIGFSTCSRRSAADQPGVPSTAIYRAAAETLVKQHLRDPSSAEFSDVRVVPAAGNSPSVVCGKVNARNGFGGMAGTQRFVAGGTVTVEGEIGTEAMTELWRRSC
ncbi:hypothetical protein M0208_06450 [Sphingomonas sp. SUN019]|uniref:hypothetical protein n=1 Tax=Sphingomonas sp. SUN019 TaxID=2937788 RepID=UPI002164A94F|nr:hypothetical protein [Sphingomonas sp. SUN019]UVO50177.1 hypothetical protein M0208_06450 [Sphingomonas sp. SUN019]